MLLIANLEIYVFEFIIRKCFYKIDFRRCTLYFEF